MSEIVREQLREAVRTFGSEIASDARKCEALLNDLCKNLHKREIFVLVSAVRQRIPDELRYSTAGIPHDVIITRLVTRLTANMGLAERMARWGVESWAIAYGVMSASPSTNSASTTSEIENPFEEASSLDKIEMLRQAVRKALEDNKITDDEKNELNILRRTLAIAPEVASHVFAEEVERRSAPQEAFPSAPSPQNPLQPVPPSPEWSRYGAIAVMMAVVLVITAAAFLFYGNEFSTQTQRAATSGGSAHLLQVEHLYAARDVIVRKSATTDSLEVGRIARGTAVSGTWTSGIQNTRWLRITDNSFKDGHISAVNLATTPRPEIVDRLNSNMTVRQAAEMRDGPGVSAQVEQFLAPGLVLFVFGRTSTDWMEVQPRSGGVGYVPKNAFELVTVSGSAEIVDTATVRVSGQTLHLSGLLSSSAGTSGSKMQEFLREQGGVLTCTLETEGGYRCRTSTGIDLGAAALLNGAAQTASGALPEYQHYEARARAAQRGIWGTQRPINQ